MTTKKEYMQKYVIDLRLKLKNRYGFKCNICQGSKCYNLSLEFAHVKPTKLNGRGRGRLDRLVDIRRNPDCYMLMGKSCHIQYDAKVYITTGE